MVPVPIMLDVPPTPDFIPGGAAVPIVGELIPIVAIVLGIGFVMLRVYLDFRRRRELYQLYHAERMAAIEKGIELPPLPTDFFRDARKREPAATRYRRRGLVLLFIGIALTVALWRSAQSDIAAWWGLVPTGWGLALLVSSFFERKEQTQSPTAHAAGSEGDFSDPPS